MESGRVSGIALALTTLLFTGCATMNTVRSAPEDLGRSLVYPQPYEKVFHTTLQVVQGYNLKVIEQNQAQRYILASHGISGFSWGERIRITFQPLSDSRTQVTILSKRVIATNVFAPDWQKKLYDRLTVALGNAESTP